MANSNNLHKQNKEGRGGDTILSMPSSVVS